MDQVILVVEFEFAPDRAEDGFAGLKHLCEQTHANDSGCGVYAVHRFDDEPNRAVLIEKWESADALHTHHETEHVQSLLGFDGFATPPRVLRMSAAGFGDPDKGLL